METHIILGNDNNDFIIILHGSPDEWENIEFQWYMTEDPKSDKKEKIKNQSYESIALLSKTIKKQFMNKWIYCECKKGSDTYNKGYFYLTDSFINMIKDNSFSDISLFDPSGNIDENKCYIQKK